MLKIESEVAKRGYDIYKKLCPGLERDRWGEYVAIELASENYFLGQDINEAMDRAEEKYPDGKFFVVQIGELATASFKNRFSI
jgi:hypothetical protein